MSSEYGIRYWQSGAFLDTEHFEPVAGGSLEAAEVAARGCMTLGHKGVQFVKRTPGGRWRLVRKVSPGREFVREVLRKLRNLMSRNTYDTIDDLPEGFALTEEGSGLWTLTLPERGDLQGWVSGPDEESLRKAAWAIDAVREQVAP